MIKLNLKIKMDNKEHLAVRENKYRASSIEEAIYLSTGLEQAQNRAAIAFENQFGEDNALFTTLGELEAENQDISLTDLFKLAKERILAKDENNKHEIAKYLDDYNELDNAYTKLHEEWHEPAEQRLMKRRSDVMNKTDWDLLIPELIKQYDSHIPLEVQGDICNLTGFLISPQTSSLLEIGRSQNSLNRLETIVSQQGYELDEPNNNHEHEGWFTQGDLEGILDEWSNAFERTKEYLAPSRKRWFNTRGKEYLRTASQIKNLLGRLDIKKDTAVPSSLMVAIENQAADLLRGVRQESDSHFAELNKKRANMLYVTNSEFLKETTGIEDTHAWINDRLSRYPDKFVESIGFIEFVNGTLNYHNEEKLVEVGGRLRDDENKIYVDILKNDYEKHRKHESDEELMAALKKEVQGTLDHELAHHIHKKVLGLQDLIEWEIILGEDPEPVDNYAKTLRKEWKNTNQQDAAVMRSRYGFETFAISLEMYMQNPAKLATNFPAERFEYFNTRFGLYDASEANILIMTLKSLLDKRPQHLHGFYYQVTNEKLGVKP